MAEDKFCPILGAGWISKGEDFPPDTRTGKYSAMCTTDCGWYVFAGKEGGCGVAVIGGTIGYVNADMINGVITALKTR